jgi:hypothetical protein
MEKPTKSTVTSTCRRPGLSIRTQVHSSPPAQQTGGIGNGSAGVDDIVDEQHPPAGEIDLDAVEKVHRTAALCGKAIAAQPHELDLGAGSRPVERAHEVGGKHRSTLQQPNHDEIVGDRPCDLGGERRDRTAISAALIRLRMPTVCTAGARSPAGPTVNRSRRRR